MFKTIYQTAIIILILLLFLTCKNEELIPRPNASELISPLNNSACLKGTSETETSTEVNFTWNKANYADSYQLNITNLLTQQITTNKTDDTSYTATLKSNTPFSWSVTSINSKGKTFSPVWKFFLSGLASNNYAPFPAELITPTNGETIKSGDSSNILVAFRWNGSDPDNDIISYSFYLDQSNASIQVDSLITSSNTSQKLERGKTYYWRIATTDKVGNTSTSVANSFSIN